MESYQSLIMQRYDSYKILQVNAFFWKTSCKYLARKNIYLQDSFKEQNLVKGSWHEIFFCV